MVYAYNVVLDIQPFKKKKFMQYTMTWMKLEDNMLSVIIQSKKDNYCTIPLIKGILNSQIYKT